MEYLLVMAGAGSGWQLTSVNAVACMYGSWFAQCMRRRSLPSPAEGRPGNFHGPLAYRGP